ncbi:hypothetical protein ABW19_dt0208584 [Dactylella cylindrospora]|nr:hypothetical protein ABW19_dt0208584 [Dactylella cylindrospora]
MPSPSPPTHPPPDLLQSFSLPPTNHPHETSTSSTPSLPTRLNIHPFARFLFANIFAFTGTFISTAIRTTHTASLQFRAENAHRLPRSQKDWFFYHRSRNYYSAYRAFVAGWRRALGMCGYVGLFVIAENGVDVARGRVDFLGTVVAGGVTGGVFGGVNKLPLATTALTVKKGLWYGFLYGVAQDVMLSLRGERIFWIDPFIGRIRREVRRDEEEAKGSLQEDGR